MSTRSILAAMIAVLLVSGCARRVPKPVNVAPGTPHMSFVLMFGDRDNADTEFACESEPRTECVIPASRVHAQSFSDLHIYYHGAGPETRYEGTLRIGFLQGAESYVSRRTITVRKKEAIANQSVLGIVTSTPGTYQITWSFNATVPETGRTFPVNETIQVSVK
jgi:hypothetical protein